MIRRSLMFSIILICIIAILVVVMTSAGQGSVASAQTVQSTPTQVTPPVSSGPGVPAIHPSLTGNVANSPRITENDVRTFHKTHAFFGGSTVNGAMPTVSSVQFITASQASSLMKGADIGVATTAIVCYVQLQGPFSQESASVFPGSKGLPTVAYGVEIFDAQTGNLLMIWTPSD